MDLLKIMFSLIVSCPYYLFYITDNFREGGTIANGMHKTKKKQISDTLVDLHNIIVNLIKISTNVNVFKKCELTLLMLQQGETWFDFPSAALVVHISPSLG